MKYETLREEYFFHCWKSELRPASQLPKPKQPEQSIEGMCRSRRTPYRSWKHLTIQIHEQNFHNSETRKKKHKRRCSQHNNRARHLFLRLSRSEYTPWQPEIRVKNQLKFLWSRVTASVVTSQVLKRPPLSKIMIEKIWESETIRKLSTILGPSDHYLSFGPCFFLGGSQSLNSWVKHKMQQTVHLQPLAVEEPLQQSLQRCWRRGQAWAVSDCHSRKGYLLPGFFHKKTREVGKCLNSSWIYWVYPVFNFWSQLSHEKKTDYFPLYWLFNRDTYNGLW